MIHMTYEPCPYYISWFPIFFAWLLILWCNLIEVQVYETYFLMYIAFILFTCKHWEVWVASNHVLKSWFLNT